jgi:aldehyde:ferredoxin oxidoreductase
MYGYHNKIAWIDLSGPSVEYRPVDPADEEQFIGGANLGAAILARETGPETDPLGPDNPLIFLTGPFTATRVPSGSRHELVSLSPATGIYAESNCGGSFGWRLKKAGLDGLVIKGIADLPLAIVIDEDEITFRPAEDLWGLDVFSADEKLKEETGDDKGVSACIGQAGENLVRFASISHDGRHTRAAGRCGLGAVMGSKKLKALFITSRGKAQTPLADPQGLRDSVRAALPLMKERLDLFGKMGTPGGVINYHKLGNLPIQNWRAGQAEEIAEKTTGTVMKETIWVSRAGCKGCPIMCGRLVEVPKGEFAIDGTMEGPEYETLAAFGSLILNDNLEAIARANELCNRMGLDTISCGSVLAFAMECWEKGVITPEISDGLDLSWGNMEAALELIRRIALQEGELARILGLGTRGAAQRLGNGAAEWAVEVKGLEFPMHDPRFSWGHALSYSTGNRGACHLTSLSHIFELAVALPEMGYETPPPGREAEGKVPWVIHLQNLMNLQDSLITCKFSMINNALRITNFLEWYNLATGRDLDLKAFMEAGERGFTLKRMINNRRGISRKDDILPPRMRTLKRKGDEYCFDIPPLLPMLSEYYELRGWSEEGSPNQETRARLGLENAPV